MAVYGITGFLALAANTANQVICGVVSGSAGTDGAVTWLDITMDAAAPAQGVKIELFRATGGIPTLTSYTPNRLSADAQALATGMASAWVPPVTATPTGVTVIKTWYVNPAGGLLAQWPLKREDYMPAATTDWIGVRASTVTGVSPDLAFNFSWDELCQFRPSIRV
jgi:hypothetical protein